MCTHVAGGELLPACNRIRYPTSGFAPQLGLVRQPLGGVDIHVEQSKLPSFGTGLFLGRQFPAGSGSRSCSWPGQTQCLCKGKVRSATVQD